MQGPALLCILVSDGGSNGDGDHGAGRGLVAISAVPIDGLFTREIPHRYRVCTGSDLSCSGCACQVPRPLRSVCIASLSPADTTRAAILTCPTSPKCYALFLYWSLGGTAPSSLACRLARPPTLELMATAGAPTMRAAASVQSPRAPTRLDLWCGTRRRRRCWRRRRPSGIPPTGSYRT